MKRPTPDQIETARSWLDVNEGEEGEAEACRAVAAWLRHLESARTLRTLAREAKVPMRDVRKAIKRTGP
jgi:hypothetical protein